MMPSAGLLILKRKLSGRLFAITLDAATIIDAPRSSKISETVVDVGRPRVLNTSSKNMSVSMTARKMMITFSKEKYSGLKMPSRAISIIPAEDNAPTNIPAVAIHIIVRNGATLDPMAELRKLTASLPTPTIRSDTASIARTLIPNKRNNSKILAF